MLAIYCCYQNTSILSCKSCLKLAPKSPRVSEKQITFTDELTVDKVLQLCFLNLCSLNIVSYFRKDFIFIYMLQSHIFQKQIFFNSPRSLASFKSKSKSTTQLEIHELILIFRPTTNAIKNSILS